MKSDINQKFYKGLPDQRAVERTRLASIVPIDSSRWDLELSKPATSPEMMQLLDKFHDKPLEDNLFFDRIFLSAAFGRMDNGNTSLLTVWETIGDERILRMYFPVVPDRAGLFGKKIWRCWSHDFAPLGVPIVSMEDAGEVLDRFLQLIAQIDRKQFTALLFENIPIDGVFADRFREALNSCDFPFRQIEMQERAVLARERNNRSSHVLSLSAKKLRQHGRQQRRLSELGEFELECVTSFSDINLRFEEFLLLEANGWKGRKGTSIQTIKQTAAFARQAVTDLAKSGNCAIYSIRLDGKSIASLIVLKTNNVYLPWKIAFDQAYARFSPGALLMLRVSETITKNKSFLRADSLASPTNNLMNLLWKRRMKIGAIVIPMGNTPATYLDAVALSIRRKNSLKQWAKSLLTKN